MSKIPAELKALLSLDDKHGVEIITNIGLSKCGPPICALLNSQGGYLVCGLGKKGKIVGVEHAVTKAAHLETILGSEIQPPVPISVLVQFVETIPLIVIEVPAGKDIPYAYSSDIYVRDGKKTKKADVYAIRDMLLCKPMALERWERLLSAELKERNLSDSACQKLLSAERTPKAVKRSSQGLRHQLQLLALTKYGRFTNAADILLAKSNGKRHPQARVRAVCYRHQNDDDYQAMRHFEGPMVDIIERLIAFIVQHTPSKAVADDPSLATKPATHSSTDPSTNPDAEPSIYPLVAIREGIVNAFAHRDYSNFTGGIKVEVNPLQVQIWNSGGFLDGMDEQKLQQGHTSVLRNPNIAHCLYLQGYMEKLGHGSVIIRSACQKAGLPAPQWQSDGAFGVTLTFFAPTTVVNTVQPTIQPSIQQTVHKAAGSSAGDHHEMPLAVEVNKLLAGFSGELSTVEIITMLNLKDREYVRDSYIKPSLAAAVIERTIPEKPKSPKQKYRLTALGKQLQQALNNLSSGEEGSATTG